jgi:hypothetical protein
MGVPLHQEIDAIFDTDGYLFLAHIKDTALAQRTQADKEEEEKVHSPLGRARDGEKALVNVGACRFC